MAINPQMVLDFAQNVGAQQPLTQIGGAFFDARQQRQAQEQMEQQSQTYQTMLNQYTQNRTPENLMAVYRAAEPLGKFESVKEQIAGMQEEERRAQVERNMSIVAPLVSGNNDLALENIDSQIAAFQSSGDEEEAQMLQGLRVAIQEGDTDRVTDYLTLITGAIGEEGTQAVNNLLSFRKDLRDTAMTEAQLIEIGSGLRWNSEADERRAMEAVDGLNMPIGRAIMELGSVLSTSGLDSAELTEQFQSLRKEYKDYVKDFDITLNSADQIRGLVESGADTGMLDAAILDYFNRVTNPDAVVRQSDVARTQDAQGVWRQVENLRGRLERGTSFTQETRQDMLNVVEAVRKIAEEARQEESGAIDSSLQRISGDNQDFLRQARNEVFGPGWSPGGNTGPTQSNRALQTVQDSELYTYLTDEEKESIQGMSEEQLRAEFPDVFVDDPPTAAADLTPTQQQQFKEYLAEANGIPLSQVQNISIDALIQNNPGSWRGFSQREGIQQPDMTLSWD